MKPKLISMKIEIIISSVITFVKYPLFMTWVGALCGHMLTIYSPDFKGTLPFLEKMIPRKSETFHYRLNFLILPFIGALIAFVLLEPTSLRTSIFAGLSWSSTLSAYIKKSSTKINQD